MEKMNTSPTRSFRSVGGPISTQQFETLTAGFKATHPTEQSTVFIAREWILESLRQTPGIAGIRFNYGIHEGADATSRTIVLVPCLDDAPGRSVPNFLFLRKGYLTSEGMRVTTGQCWSLFTRYVDRMTELLPGVQRKDIPRACFYGADILEKMLNDENVAGIVYHFGYNPAVNTLGRRYQPALKAVDVNFMFLDSPVDTGNPCPPAVCGGSIFFSLGRLLPHLVDETLVEMHHYALPVLSDLLQQQQVSPEESQTLLETQFADCLALAEAGQPQQATALFRQRWEGLLNMYLYNR